MKWAVTSFKSIRNHRLIYYITIAYSLSLSPSTSLGSRAPATAACATNSPTSHKNRQPWPTAGVARRRRLSFTAGGRDFPPLFLFHFTQLKRSSQYRLRQQHIFSSSLKCDGIISHQNGGPCHYSQIGLNEIHPLFTRLFRLTTTSRRRKKVDKVELFSL